VWGKKLATTSMTIQKYEEKRTTFIFSRGRYFFGNEKLIGRNQMSGNQATDRWEPEDYATGT